MNHRIFSICTSPSLSFLCAQSFSSLVFFLRPNICSFFVEKNLPAAEGALYGAQDSLSGESATEKADQE